MMGGIGSSITAVFLKDKTCVLPLLARLSFFVILTLCGVGEMDDTCIIFVFEAEKTCPSTQSKHTNAPNIMQFNQARTRLVRCSMLTTKATSDALKATAIRATVTSAIKEARLM
jgi:hypothetical protein